MNERSGESKGGSGKGGQYISVMEERMNFRIEPQWGKTHLPSRVQTKLGKGNGVVLLKGGGH